VWGDDCDGDRAVEDLGEEDRVRASSVDLDDAEEEDRVEVGR
jgi:hypothetical protein